MKPPGGEAGLAHKQKLDCALQLARTVALDFNNALTSILGHTSLVLSKMEPNHPWRGSLIEVEKSAAKAAEIANDLGTFSRQEKEARAQAAGNLNLLLQRSVEFFQQNAGPEPVDWTLQLDRKLFAAKFDEAKMQQAFMKILENALQALRGAGAALPSRRATSSWRSRRRTATCNWPPALMCAWKSATTAAASSRRSCRGCSSPSSRPSAAPAIAGWAWPGSMALSPTTAAAWRSPASPAPAPRCGFICPAEKKLVRDDGVTSDDLSGTQTILMVDDEDLLLTMGKTILSTYGYRVLTANGGQKALDILAQKDATVDLVITDLVMPAMSGRELVEHIRQLSPGDAHHLHQRLRVAGRPGERRRLPAKAVHQPGTAAQSQAGPECGTRRRRNLENRLKQQLTAFVKCRIQCSYANRESESLL